MCKQKTTLYITDDKKCDSISSSIETIDPYSNLISMDKDYKYKLNIRTKGPLSSNVDIYLDDNALKSYLLEPLEYVLSHDKTSVYARVINVIDYNDRAYYRIYKFINNNILMEFFKKSYTLSLESRFIVREHFLEIHSKLSYKILFFKHYPKNIQPKTIILPVHNAKELYNEISML